MALPEGTLPRIDRPPIESIDLDPDFERWLTHFVDQINEALRVLETLL